MAERGFGSRGRGGYDRGGFEYGRGYERGGSGRGGFDRGRGRGGFDRGGFDHGGFDRGGFDRGGFDRGGFDRGRSGPRPSYGPPPSAQRGRGGPRPAQMGGFDEYRGGGYSGPGAPRGAFEQRMPPPMYPPRGGGRGGDHGGIQPSQPGARSKADPWGRAREVSGDRGATSIDQSKSSDTQSESEIQTHVPSERGDSVSPASSTENLSEAARQKKSHPILRPGTDIASALSKLSIQRSVRIPSRPDQGGQVGKRVEVITNCWDVSVNTKDVLMYFVETVAVYRLDKKKGEKVEIRMPPKEKRALIQQIVNALPGDVIYDGGHAIYSEKPIPGISKEGVQKEMEIKDPLNRDVLILEYRIMEVQTVSTNSVKAYTADKHATSLDMPQDSIRLLDCLLKTICKGSFVAVGRTALFYENYVKKIHDKLFTIHQGFITSVRPQWKVRVNIDMTCKAFFTCGNLADVMYEKYGDNMANCGRQMGMDLRKIRVETIPFYKTEAGEPYSRRFTVQGISSESAANLIIADINQSVEQYFKQHHNITLKYPELPCVKVSLNRDVFLPMELLTILPYQSPNAKKSDIASEVIRCAAVRVHDRFKELETFVNRLSTSSHPLVSRFGLKVDQRPVKTPARVLDTPTASFGRQVMQLGRGKWVAPSFFSPASASGVIQWAVYSIPGDRNAQMHQSKLIKEILNWSSRFNIQMGQPEVGTIQRAQLQERFQYLQSRGVQFALLILYDDLNYPVIKRLSDIELGIRTQCVRGRTIDKPNVVPNLLLKINGKLGGINWQIKDVLRDDKELIMVFGADVTHPAPTQIQQVRQSIAAVIGSITPDLMRYAVVVRQQATTEKGNKTTREIIDAMESIVSELLKAFYKNSNGRLPTRLMFYRDGVSEGQFENVLVEELAAIQRACSGIRPDYQPAITYIVVQKRHHLRFKPTDIKMRNVDPGTVVDTEVTHPREFDFYLCSQEGIQGTSKPAHYHVLYDDSNWTSDALQRFTYFLCHAYMRCSRSVSYPAPTYYAHLAAFRARDWISDLDKPNALLREGKFRVHESQVTGMYYL